MTRRLFATALLATALACGGSSPTAPAPAPVQGLVTLTIAPNPATSTVCSPACVSTNGNSYQFRATATLTIQETAGVAVNIDSITSGSISYTSADVTQRSGTNRVAANANLLFPLFFVYGPEGNANASRSTLFPIVVAFTDDHGIHGIATTQWAVN